MHPYACMLSFLEPFGLPYKLLRMVISKIISEDRSFLWYLIWQILNNPDMVTYKKLTFGEIANWICPFHGKKASQNSMRRRCQTRAFSQAAITGKANGKLERKKKDRYRFVKKRRKSPNFSICAFGVGGKNLPLVLEISFIAIPMLTGRKTVKKRRFGQNCGFFPKQVAKCVRSVSNDFLYAFISMFG